MQCNIKTLGEAGGLEDLVTSTDKDLKSPS